MTIADYRSLSNSGSRLAAVQSLNGSSEDDRSVLLVALTDKNLEVRKAAIYAAGEFKRKECAQTVAARLKLESDPLIRVAATECLAQLQDPSSISSLVGALLDRSPLVRGWAARALGAFDGLAVDDHLTHMLTHERSHFVRVCALGSLVGHGHAALLLDLVAELKSPNYRVQCAAATTLAEACSPDNVNVVVGALDTALHRKLSAAARSADLRALADVSPQSDRAIAIIREFASREPVDCLALYHLSRAYAKRGDTDHLTVTLGRLLRACPSQNAWAVDDSDLSAHLSGLHISE